MTRRGNEAADVADPAEAEAGAGEPAHLVLFLVFTVAMGIGMFYYRFR